MSDNFYHQGPIVEGSDESLMLHYYHKFSDPDYDPYYDEEEYG